nr:MAG TPA: hypothetical protein [Caudoviricetes sp.]
MRRHQLPAWPICLPPVGAAPPSLPPLPASLVSAAAHHILQPAAYMSRRLGCIHLSPPSNPRSVTPFFPIVSNHHSGR